METKSFSLRMIGIAFCVGSDWNVVLLIFAAFIFFPYLFLNQLDSFLPLLMTNFTTLARHSRSGY